MRGIGLKEMDGMHIIKFESIRLEVSKFKVKFVRGLNFEDNLPLMDSTKGISSLNSNLKGYFSYHKLMVLDKLHHL